MIRQMVNRTEKANTGFGNVFVGCSTATVSAETPPTRAARNQL
jgi:hypothetical protein